MFLTFLEIWGWALLNLFLILSKSEACCSYKIILIKTRTFTPRKYVSRASLSQMHFILPKVLCCRMWPWPWVNFNVSSISIICLRLWHLILWPWPWVNFKGQNGYPNKNCSNCLNCYLPLPFSFLSLSLSLSAFSLSLSVSHSLSVTGFYLFSLFPPLSLSLPLSPPSLFFLSLSISLCLSLSSLSVSHSLSITGNPNPFLLIFILFYIGQIRYLFPLSRTRK